ncbi:MAG TPA: response regulator [Elusimicrobiota bacterium]|nr:response regulator [Elusimicrobiota bacterium]
MDSKKQFEKYYTTAEAARLCHVSHSTIFRAALQKKLNAYSTPGGHFRIAPADLEKFAKDNGLPYTPEHTRRKKILVVEDNAVELRLIKRLLEKDPFLEVQTTQVGFKAGFLMQVFRPELVVLDIYLGETDGREIVRLVRADATLSTTKIVALTAAKDPEEIAAIKKSGVDFFMAKPVNPKTFLSEIKALL